MKVRETEGKKRFFPLSLLPYTCKAGGRLTAMGPGRPRNRVACILAVRDHSSPGTTILGKVRRWEHPHSCHEISRISGRMSACPQRRAKKETNDGSFING